MTGVEPTLPIRLSVIIFKLRDFASFFTEDNNDTQGDREFLTNETNMRLSRYIHLHGIRHNNCVPYETNNLQSMTFLL
jgi:hypothetical protein